MASAKTDKIRTMIVDDEPLARANLVALLRRDVEIEIVGQCKSGTEAVPMICTLQPDLLFLDVEMPGCNGFDVLEQLGPAIPGVVIFVTAYSHYAPRAFEAEALDYLLKPFSTSRFEKVMQRAKCCFRDSDVLPKRVVVKSSGRAVFLRVDEIDWIEAADYYACLHVAHKSHLIRRSLSDLEIQLGAELFVRVHRSAIVNLRRIRSITSDANGDSEILLSTGASVRLSRSYRDEVHRRVAGLLL